MKTMIKITQIRSSIGCLPKHRATLIGLGLKKIWHSVYRENTPSVRGMIRSIHYMVKFEE